MMGENLAKKIEILMLFFVFAFVFTVFLTAHQTLAVNSSSTNYRIDGGQISPIYGSGSSTNYSIETGGNPISGDSTSTNYQVQQGAPLDSSTNILTVDIVDSGGDSVPNPSIVLNAIGFPITFETTNGTLGVTAEKIRVNNDTTNPQWSLSVAASSTTALWDGAVDYDFNDPTAGAGDGGDADSLGGQMTVDSLTSGVITPQGGCTDIGLTLGNATSFNEGVVDAITVLSAGVTATTSCFWDLTTVDISQTIPGEQDVDSYSIDIILTVVAI